MGNTGDSRFCPRKKGHNRKVLWGLPKNERVQDPQEDEFFWCESPRLIYFVFPYKNKRVFCWVFSSWALG